MVAQIDFDTCTKYDYIFRSLITNGQSPAILLQYFKPTFDR